MKQHSQNMISENPTPQKVSGRLLALDILRGITIAGMILVNNPGSWGHMYAPLRHAEWNGLTPTDLVFPFFMFIMGISTYFSLRKYDFKFSVKSFWKILRRSVLLFLIGMAVAWFGLFLRGLNNDATFLEAVFNFDRIRLLGVIPRLALCYGVGATMALLIPRKGLPLTVVAMLVVYAIVLIFGNGFEFSDKNVLYIVDNKIIGPNNLYKETIGDISLHLDPEGLLSTFPSIAHMLIGFLCGGLIMSTRDNELRINKLFIVGVILTFSGFLLDYGIPVNKKIWSPTFVLTTCGLASSFLGLLIWIIDIKGYRRWCRFFEVFGINPLFLYCLGAVMTLLISFIRVPFGESTMSIKGIVYSEYLLPLCGDDATFASFMFAVVFLVVNWLIGLILYKKKIYIKL